MRKRLWTLTLIIPLLALGLAVSACNNEEPEDILEPEVTEPYEATDVDVATEGGEVEGVLAEEPLVEGETVEPMEPGAEQEPPVEAPVE